MEKKYVFFMGQSGVGKTTTMKYLVKTFPDLFFMPIFTVTRKPRYDDEVGAFEYVSHEHYKRCREEMFIDLSGGYCYRKEAIHSSLPYALLYGSPYALEEMLHLKKSKMILIEGDAEFGLSLRGLPAYLLEERQGTNKLLQNIFYKQEWFRKKMDLILTNDFANHSTLQYFTNHLLSSLVNCMGVV
ncbi:MAG: hypothetical protein Q8Q23_03960 [bacterium]|nr:hypothetical protein [bacterium]